MRSIAAAGAAASFSPRQASVASASSASSSSSSRGTSFLGPRIVASSSRLALSGGGGGRRCSPSSSSVGVSSSSIEQRRRTLSSSLTTTSSHRHRLAPPAGLNNNDGGAKPAPSARRPADSAPRLAIPSKGRMAEDTLQLLRDCQLSVFKPNPRQYVASIPQLPGVEVWFQRASDVVRKLSYGDVDLGIVGYDMFAEISGAAMVGGGANGNANGDGKNPSDLIHGDLVVLHDALGFGGCHLGLGVPAGEGRFADVDSLDDLLSMPDWTPETPLRVVTGYQNVARAFFESKGFSDRVALLGADGALEAAPLMGCADIILDLVSTGVTLRENNLKEIEGGTVLKSQGVLVANRHALLRDGGRLLDIVHELIERLEAHLKADNYYSVVANMRGPTSRAVADRILACDGLGGLEGPTVSPVFAPQKDGKKSHSKAPTPNGDDDELELDDEGNDGLWAAVICVPKRRLYDSVKELRAIGGSGVLVQPMTYIFDEEPARWRALLEALGKGDYVPGNGNGNGASSVSSREAAARAA